MNAQETYRLSSQQSAVLAPHWTDEVAATVVIASGPGDAATLDALRSALHGSVARHEILRTRYRAVPGLRDPVQVIEDELAPAFALLEGADDERLLDAARDAIDLQRGAVVAITATLIKPGRIRLALAAPSLALDVQAVQELLAECLTGGAATEVLQYADYVAWQQDLLAGELGRDGARFWRGQEASAPRLPFETVGTGRRGPAESRMLGAEALEGLRALATRTVQPEQTVLASLWAGWLALITGQGDFGVEWRCGKRAEELAGSLGCFDGLLPLALSLDLDASADRLVRHVAERLEAAAAWHECFDAPAFLDAQALAGRSRPGIAISCTDALTLPKGWAVDQLAIDPGPQRLRCDALAIDGGWRLRLAADDRSDASTLRTWLAQFEVLLSGLGHEAAQPWRQRSLLGPTERARIVAAAATPRPEGLEPSPTLHALFEAEARRVPQALALVCGTRALTYGELDARASRLAQRLLALGAGPERTVGVHLGRSVDAIVAMIGVMKSGAAYVPLDPSYPAERIALMIEDAGLSAVVVDRGRAASSGEQAIPRIEIDDADEPVSAGPVPACEAAGDHLAYLIYTSGSTGRPKGVMVSHANAVASTTARFAFYGEPVDRFLLLSSFSFDSSVAGIFWTLGQGGTLCLPTDDAHRDPLTVAALVADLKISHLLALPSFYKQIAARLAPDAPLRCAIVAGEACHADVVDLHRRHAPQAALVNEYGPTEGTVWSNALRIEAPTAAGQSLPIGRAIPGMRSIVLDDALEPCATGVAGELYIGGAGITRGYCERPGLTAERFVADPFEPGSRLYRTSDLARLRPDGSIEYLGRADQQVKLRGHRIELGEIEAALKAHARVSDAVALVHDDAEIGQRLIAYVAAEDAGAALQDELETGLRARLPAFMVPSAIVVMAALPQMPNGKVDRQTLLALGATAQRPVYVAPVSDIERGLAAIWGSVLKIDEVGLDDDFFDLGGHSLLGTQVTARILQQFAVELPLRELFEAGTLRDLAAKVEARRESGRDEIALLDDLLAEAEAGQ
ncbi:amino acid adenylation domain-containing protein [Roseateles sp. BYS180W]|uniref:Amino acid adenylation domain-containing protein n=1 Tax=Roseateles rivi TaxID=3299028 RepID=A0ABW7FZQ1_9BURK